MNIYFQKKNIDIYAQDQDVMAERMCGLNKFFLYGTHVYVDLERTRASHNGRDLYYASIHISEQGKKYFAEEYRENLHKAFSYAYENILRVVRNDKSKARNIARKAGQKIKSIFKRY